MTPLSGSASDQLGECNDRILLVALALYVAILSGLMIAKGIGVTPDVLLAGSRSRPSCSDGDDSSSAIGCHSLRCSSVGAGLVAVLAWRGELAGSFAYAVPAALVLTGRSAAANGLILH